MWNPGLTTRTNPFLSAEGLRAALRSANKKCICSYRYDPSTSLRVSAMACGSAEMKLVLVYPGFRDPAFRRPRSTLGYSLHPSNNTELLGTPVCRAAHYAALSHQARERQGPGCNFSLDAAGPSVQYLSARLSDNIPHAPDAQSPEARPFVDLVWDRTLGSRASGTSFFGETYESLFFEQPSPSIEEKLPPHHRSYPGRQRDGNWICSLCGGRQKDAGRP